MRAVRNSLFLIQSLHILLEFQRGGSGGGACVCVCVCVCGGGGGGSGQI